METVRYYIDRIEARPLLTEIVGTIMAVLLLGLVVLPLTRKL